MDDLFLFGVDDMNDFLSVEGLDRLSMYFDIVFDRVEYSI